MAEAEFIHQEDTLLHGFIERNGARVRRHDFSDRSVGGVAADGYNAVHNVALGKNSRKLSVAHHGERANIVLHHEASGFEHGVSGIDGINSAIFHEVAKRGHRETPWSTGRAGGAAAAVFAGENTLPQAGCGRVTARAGCSRLALS